jgi:hypothetical protein
VIDSAALRWYRLISEAEAVRICKGLGLASVWQHINADDYPSARREMDRVYHDWGGSVGRRARPVGRGAQHDQHRDSQGCGERPAQKLPVTRRSARDLVLAGVAVGGRSQLAEGGLQLPHREPAVAIATQGDVLEHRQGEAPVPSCVRNGRTTVPSRRVNSPARNRWSNQMEDLQPPGPCRTGKYRQVPQKSRGGAHRVSGSVARR